MDQIILNYSGAGYLFSVVILCKEKANSSNSYNLLVEIEGVVIHEDKD
jgi:hypothetical protein